VPGSVYTPQTLGQLPGPDSNWLVHPGLRSLPPDVAGYLNWIGWLDDLRGRLEAPVAGLVKDQIELSDSASAVPAATLPPPTNPAAVQRAAAFREWGPMLQWLQNRQERLDGLAECQARAGLTFAGRPIPQVPARCANLHGIYAQFLTQETDWSRELANAAQSGARNRVSLLSNRARWLDGRRRAADREMEAIAADYHVSLLSHLNPSSWVY
jgi:hypothetical protein